MGLPEELWTKLHAVSAAARREKVPGPAYRALDRIANSSLEWWRENPSLMYAFAARALPKDRVSAARLLENSGYHVTAFALEELYRILEYLDHE